MAKSFIKETSLLDREVYEFYKENRKKVANGLNDYNLFKKAVSGLMLVIRDMMVQGQGGVYIEGLGYFCNVMYPKKYKMRGKDIPFFRRIEKQQYFFPYFFPDFEMTDWTFSDMFEIHAHDKSNITRRDYKLHFDLCQTVRIAQDYAVKQKNAKESSRINHYKRKF